MELICSGLYLQLWDIILDVLGKNIYNCNIKLICYLEIKFNEFKNYINTCNDELELRNSVTVREIFCEIITILCMSNKIQTINRVKIKPEELESVNFANKLKADKIEYANLVFSNDDPKELYIAINELIFNINRDNPNQFLIFFWIEWILKYSQKLKKNKKNIDCLMRDYPTTNKHRKNIIFLILDSISTKETNNKLLDKTLQSLINLFCIRYSPSCNNKRVYLIYLAVNIIISKSLNIDIPLVQNIEIINKIKKKNDIFYKRIKKFEHNLHSGDNNIDDEEKLAIDKSMERINMVMGKYIS